MQGAALTWVTGPAGKGSGTPHAYGTAQTFRRPARGSLGVATAGPWC